ncbi:MAG: hypothetical protein IKM08_04055 [Clostridia bacterium]|nr:hypothetical protein [Clostridia bacterium]
MICKFCGTESNQLTNCPKCGMPLAINTPSKSQNGARPKPTGTAPQPAASQAQKPQTQQPQQQKPARSQYEQYAQYAQYGRYADPAARENAQVVRPTQNTAQPAQNAAQPAQNTAQPTQKTAQPAQKTAQPAQNTAQPAQKTEQTAKNGEGSKPNMTVVNKPAPARKPEQPLQIKNVIWPAIALLLPLLYLFFELFAVLSAELAEPGVMTKIITDLTGGNLDAVKIGDMAEAAGGDGVSLYRAFSPFGLLQELFRGGSAGAAWWIPAMLVAAFSLACAVLGIVLLISRGKSLRSAGFNSALAIFGTGAVFAPLLGQLSLLLYFLCTLGLDGANAAMQCVAISPGALLIMLILLCTLAPSLAALRALSAKADGTEEYPLFPYRSAPKCSYKGLKIATLILLGCALTVLLLYLLLPITQAGSLLDYFKLMLGGEEGSPLGGWFTELSTDMGLLFTNTPNSVNPLELVALVMTHAPFLVLCVLLCVLVHAIVSFIRMVIMKEDVPTYNKTAKGLIRSLPVRLRNFVIAPLLCYVACQAFLTVLLLFCSPVLAHLDFTNVEECLNAFYVSVFYLKQAGGLSATFSLVALGAAMLWVNLRQVTLAMLVRTGKKTKKF